MSYKLEDIPLDDLCKIDWMSINAITVCKNNNFKGLNDIISFYLQHGSFKNLKSCGPNLEKELSGICSKFKNRSLSEITEEIKERDRLKKLFRQYSFDEIEAINKHIEYLVFKLSVRARNGLQRYFNGTPQALELLYKICSSTFSFHTIRNIGDKAALELDHFSQSFLNLLKEFHLHEENIDVVGNIKASSILDIELNENFAKIINEFNPFKKAAIHRHIEYLILNLKIRARNAITQFFGEPIIAKEIIETIYSYSFDFKKIKNIGSKTVSELNHFKAEIASFIDTLRFIENDDLNREYVKIIIKSTFNNLTTNFNKQFETVFINAGKLKLFKLIYFLIENDQILKQKEREIFYLLHTENYTKSFEQIATELHLTRERLRQIRINFEADIQEYFRFILSFNTQELVSYTNLVDTHFTIIDKDFVQKINSAEDVKFNVLFYSIILGLFLESSHSVLGDKETISGKGNYANAIHYKNCYIIENAIFYSFDFKAFTNNVSVNLSNRITETYALHFEGYLFQFIKQEGKQYLSSIRETCEAIIYNEFDLVVNNEGYIVFERNVKKPLVHYAIEILEALGQMTKVEDISWAINKKYPELETTEQSVRSTLQREKELFIYIGRTSTYGLKSWQEERNNLKGGTIRDLTQEYLNKYDEPRHISNISYYVLKFRPKTYERSVLDNLKADKSGKFIFFGKGFIGLKSRKYSSGIKIFKSVTKDWSEKYVELKKFRELNPDKWPSILSMDKSERLLYNFIYTNKVKYSNKELENEKIDLLFKIGFLNYLELNRHPDWYNEFDKLVSFIKVKNKIPSASSTDKSERSLYRFMYRTKKSIERKELENDKETLFTQINIH